MLTLAQAASYFDRTDVFDGYTGTLLFQCQIDPYDDSKRDAMAAYRRVMSVRPGTQLPAHLVLQTMGQHWIAAARPEADGLEELHREKYVLQAAQDRYRLGSMGQFLAGVPATEVFAFPAWVRDAKQIEESSDVANLFEVILPLGVDCAAHDVLWAGDEAFLSLSVRRLPSQFLGVQCLRLGQVAPAPATLVSRAFSPVQGKQVDALSTIVPALRVRWQSLFAYESQLATRYQEGDFALVVPAGTIVTKDTKVSFAGADHSVLDVDQLRDSVALHLRRQ